MSQRGDRGEGHRRPGRSSSFGGHRGGGVGGAGKGGGGSSGQPPLSSNRSFRKAGNGHGGHQRVVSQPDTTGFQPAPAPVPHQTPTRPPIAPQNAAAHVPVPAPRPQHHDPQLSSSSPASEKPGNAPLPKATHAAPRAPPKSSNPPVPQGASKGESSKGFNFQFGSINMNGLPQFPARTSSAPPNLDEQKRNQALLEELKVTPPGPMQPAPKQQPSQQQLHQQKQQQLLQQSQQVPQQPQQQQSRKDAVGSSQPTSVNPHLPSQLKRDVHASPSVPNVTSLRPTVQPMPGVQMSIPFHHQPAPVPLQFGGHGPQLQSQVVPSSLQMSMGLTGSNAPQVPQQLYAPTIQHHQLQQQAMMHQGQGMSYVTSVGHQFPPQLGNIPMNIPPQYPQQQPNKFVAPRKTTVKITHPDTHEELKLDKRMDSSGQRAAPNLTPQSQSQPVGGYAPHIGFFHQPSNSYNQSGIYYPPTTGVSQVPTGSSGPRFNYSVTQSGQAITYMSPSAGPPVSGQSQMTVKPHPGGLQAEKSGTHPVTISAPPGKSDAPKLRPAEDAPASRQKDSEVVSGITVSNKSAHEKETKALLVSEKNPTAVSLLPTEGTKPPTSVTANSALSLSGADGKNKESVQRSGSFKDNKKIVIKKDARNSSEPQHSASPTEDDSGDHVETKNLNKELELNSSSSGTAAPLPESRAGTTEADSIPVNAADIPGTDRSSATPTSEGTSEPQGAESIAVSAVECEESKGALKVTTDASKDNISCDATERETPEVCAVASNTDNSDAAPHETDQEQLPKESTPSVPEEQGMMSSSSKNSETSSHILDGSAVAVTTSETSEPTVQGAIDGNSDISPETGLAVSNVTQISSEGQQKSESMSSDQSVAAITGSVRPVSREKPIVEITRTKSTAGKKKKRKEMLSKADAAGTSDLYNAYKGSEEKSEIISTAEGADSSSTVDTTHVLPDEQEMEVSSSADDSKKKVEPDDWEDAADMSTPKLQSDSGNQAGTTKVLEANTTEGNGRKKYSRDFLLTLSQHCTGLPVGFQMNEAVNALMNNLTGKSYVVDREPHPSPGRGSDRPTSRGDRRGAAMADDRWTKGVPLSPGRDMDLANGPSIINYRGGPGGNHGVLRNPRGQPGGGLLLGPMHSVGPQVSRSGSDADRWQQKGLMPSPVTPMQAMHKAERKYVVGKVSDEEEAKQRQLKAILNKLTPQNFEKLFEQVKEVNIDSVATLTGVISQIFDKALMEPTFCEMYANFCFHLAGALPDFSEDNEKITFKRLLLNKCQEEFERGEREEAEADKTEEEGEVKQTKEEREEKRIRARRRMLGNIRLIGELYKKRMLTERIMHECIKKLFGNYDDPDEENIEALCKLMSTIGEMIDHVKAKEHMDAYFDIMQKMSTSQKLSSRVRFMLRDSIDLRKNKWQQRRKVEGPKKIEEVHRDAAHERHAQSSRLGRGPAFSSVPRRGAPPMDYGPRGSSALASPSSQQGSIRGMPPHSRGFGSQDIRFEERHQFDSRTVPLPQRAVKDEAITLGPQGGLARGMSIRGQPPVSNAELPSVVDHRRIVSGSNGYNSLADRTSGRTPASSQSAGPSQRPASQEGRSGNKSYSEDDLREKSISAIREYYSAKDEKEVALCIEELNAPSFYPSVVSLWVNDSFERKDMERELLAKLFVSLCSGQHNLLSKRQLIDGLASVLASLEDTLSDAPRATEYLGRLLARFVQENILPLQEVGKLIQEGGEEPGYLVQDGMAADILWAVLDSLRLEKGDSFLNEVKSSSSLKLEDFRPQHLKRSKLDAFM
ncbi:eukaryotic translation initiation factor 4G-like [Panicum miliaceum]|uniref:Eukaryotic translation initiation factor 4G n=1 Tax=Panicum miliaceum TaxID=4540 RepID=A0A3L6QRU1_PANMI|nr:eukaryotic translation initiation factor 4G-like [Panicum miliaceum]